MENRLQNKKVLIVGGTSGIGLAVAKLAARKGAHSIIASRNAPARMNMTSDAADKTMEIHTFDVTSEPDHHRLFETIGMIDHLVITVRPELAASSFQKSDIDEAKAAFETKFWGQYRLVQSVHRYMGKSGSITLTSGVAGEKIYKGASTMAIINSAIETLCRILAVELAPLRVNAVSPGFCEPKPQEVQEYARQFPLRRLASPQDVASAYIWLMENPYVTGTVTVVDGGARLI